MGFVLKKGQVLRISRISSVFNKNTKDILGLFLNNKNNTKVILGILI